MGGGQHCARAGRGGHGICFQHLARRYVRGFAGHGHHGVHNVRVVVFGHKARAKAGNAVPAHIAAADGLALVRLHRNDLYIRIPCLDVFSYARDGAAAAHAHDDGIQRAAGCPGNVRPGDAPMEFGVQVVIEIVQKISARLAHGLLGALHRARPAIDIIRKHDLRAEFC